MQTTQNKTNNEQNNAVANQIENNNSGSEQSLNAPEYNSSGTNNVLFQMKEEGATVSNSGTAQEPGNFITQMQSAFQTDFSDVNFHEDSKTASDLGALAFTQGNNVHFAPGQFKPDTQSGKELIGHELTHVVQQREGKVQPTKQIGKFNINDNSSLEKQADTMGAKAARYNPVQAKTNPNFSGNTINTTNQPIQRSSSEKEYQEHITKSNGKMAPFTKGTLCSVSAFKDITYEGFFSSSGKAKDKSVEVLENIHKKIFINTTTGKKAQNLNELNSSLLFRIQKEFIVLRGLADVWAEYNGDDQDLRKRAYGFKIFRNYLDSAINETNANLTAKGASDEIIEKKAMDAVGDERIAEVKKYYADKTANSVLTSLVPVVEKLAPEDDTTGKVNVKVEIPIEPTGIAFLGGQLTLEAEKAAGSFKTRAQIDFLAGAKLPMFKITGKLGGYIEAQGSNAKQSLNLISYGMHKRFKESSWLSPFADWAWGGANKAEAFRNAVESDAFGENSEAYVELGGIAEASAEIGSDTTLAKGEVGIKGNLGKRYDKETKGGLKGKNVKGFGVGGKVSIGPVSGEFSYDRQYANSVLSKSELAFGVSTTHGGVMKAVEIAQKIQEVFGTVKEAVEKNEDPQAALLINEAKGRATEKVQGAIEEQLGIKSGDSGLAVSATFNLIDKEVEIAISTTSEKSLDLGVVSGGAEFSKKEFSKTFNW